jgi:hypothetical protein
MTVCLQYTARKEPPLYKFPTRRPQRCRLPACAHITGIERGLSLPVTNLEPAPDPPNLHGTSLDLHPAHSWPEQRVSARLSRARRIVWLDGRLGYDSAVSRRTLYLYIARASGEYPLLVDMPVLVVHQDRGALRLDHRQDQALCRRRAVIWSLVTGIMPPTGRVVLQPAVWYRKLVVLSRQERTIAMRGAMPNSVSATPQSVKPTAR